MKRIRVYKDFVKNVLREYKKATVTNPVAKAAMLLLMVIVMTLVDILQQLVRLNAHFGTERVKGDAKSD